MVQPHLPGGPRPTWPPDPATADVWNVRVVEILDIVNRLADDELGFAVEAAAAWYDSAATRLAALVRTALDRDWRRLYEDVRGRSSLEGRWKALNAAAPEGSFASSASLVSATNAAILAQMAPAAASREQRIALSMPLANILAVVAAVRDEPQLAPFVEGLASDWAGDGFDLVAAARDLAEQP